MLIGFWFKINTRLRDSGEHIIFGLLLFFYVYFKGEVIFAGGDKKLEILLNFLQVILFCLGLSRDIFYVYFGDKPV